jgi:tRNA nucleotidyltransferase (CCA-adding enzyme)
MRKVLGAASSVDAGAIASKQSDVEKIKTAIFEARVEAIKRVL